MSKEEFKLIGARPQAAT